MGDANTMLNAHEAPPARLKDIFKKYQKLKSADVAVDSEILSFNGNHMSRDVEVLEPIAALNLKSIFSQFMEHDYEESSTVENSAVYGHKALPGLLVIPSLLPPSIQRTLLSRLLHRDWSNPRHKTNLHPHYEVAYPELPQDELGSLEEKRKLSFFSYSPLSKMVFQPKNPTVHQPISIPKVMQKSLRWITLGGQYDWTNKAYPKETPPEFPADISDLLKGLFPEMKPQAGIVNIYSPGDTLSLHRDVSEESDRGLVSISIGCDCLFLIGLERNPSDFIVVRLGSGDAVFMSKESRFAWHGVPKIIADTCPAYLKAWPAESGEGEEWHGWIKTKRINLNVRQMHD